jgi:hypothetical protein
VLVGPEFASTAVQKLKPSYSAANLTSAAAAAAAAD